jgi:Domain of unknown function (DUF4365)
MPSRTKQHLTDSKARYLVASLKPQEWEWREMTGRDYGIDMEWEPFENGNSTGRLLLLQIKGKLANIQDGVDVGFNLRVPGLKYAELFTSPIVLMACPVSRKHASCRFVWLQEYIRVRLDFENSNWRSRKSVSVYLPRLNQLPGADAEDRLRYMADYPRRLESWGHLTLIQHDVRRLAIPMWRLQAKNDAVVGQIRTLLTDAQDLPGLSKDPRNWQAQICRDQAIHPGVAACDLLLMGPPYPRAGVEALGWESTGQTCPIDNLDALLTRLERSGEQLSSYLANVMDAATSRGIWQLNPAGGEF